MALLVATGWEPELQFEASCVAGLAAETFVYVSGEETVSAVDIDTDGMYPAVGIVVEKPTSTTCIVQTGGVVEISGLTAGALYFIGLDARPLEGPPIAPTTGTRAVHPAGIALSSVKLQLTLELPTRIIPA